MTVKMYVDGVVKGRVNLVARGCRHEIIDGVVEVCREDIPLMLLKGYSRTPLKPVSIQPPRQPKTQAVPKKVFVKEEEGTD